MHVCDCTYMQLVNVHALHIGLIPCIQHVWYCVLACALRINAACLRARPAHPCPWTEHVNRPPSDTRGAQAYYSRRLLRCGWQAVRYECPSLLFLPPSRPAAVCHLVAVDDSQPAVCHRAKKRAVHQQGARKETASIYHVSFLELHLDSLSLFWRR